MLPLYPPQEKGKVPLKEYPNRSQKNLELYLIRF